MKIIKVNPPYQVKDNPDLKYWVRVVGSYIGFTNETEYRTWLQTKKDLVEVEAYK